MKLSLMSVNEIIRNKIKKPTKRYKYFEFSLKYNFLSIK
jgi:hypothetical protein